MKRTLLILALLAFALPSQAADIITKRLTVTNAANINSTNAYTITVNADVRTWTNNVVTASTQILATTNNTTAVIRLLQHFVTYPVADTELLTDGSTYVAWRGEAGAALALTLNTNTWGAITATTNTTGTAGTVVSVPYSFFSAANQTNIANGLSDWLNLAANTTGISAAKLLSGTVPLARLSGITTNQIDAVFHGLLMTGDTDDQTAAEVVVTPAGAIAANDVQEALEELDTEKQPIDADLTDLADGSLTGSKVGTGIDAGNITTGTLAEARAHADLTRDSELAAAISDTVYGVGWDADTTHAPSKNAVYDKIEAMLLGGGLGTGDIDTSAEIRGIVTDESGTGALLFGGGDVGAATATTPSAADNDTSVATTAFVQGELLSTKSTLNIGSGTVTNNIGAILSVGDTTFVDVLKASQTNSVTGALTFAHATNGVHGVDYTHVRWIFVPSGGPHTLTIPSGWRTNVYSAVPPALTNGTITRMILSCGGPTADAASQTNCYVSFEYFK